MLGALVNDARFLDLFAGSGAVGLEAWSRGAAFVCWIESDRRALGILKENVGELCDSGTKVLAGDVCRFLEKGWSEGPFDIVFADPPYEKGRKDRSPGRGKSGSGRERGVLARVIDAVDRGDILARGGILITEQHAGEQQVACEGWEVVRDRVYGKTKLTVLKRVERASDNQAVRDSKCSAGED